MHTAETKERIRQKMLGVNKGRHLTEEHIEKIKRNSQRRGKFLDKSTRWKGGRWIKDSGYIFVYTPDHPYSNPNGYVFEHRLIMEKHIGRYLTKDEVVHHINKDKQDNRIENLQLMTRSKHMKLEMQYRKIQ